MWPRSRHLRNKGISCFRQRVLAQCQHPICCAGTGTAIAHQIQRLPQEMREMDGSDTRCPSIGTPGGGTGLKDGRQIELRHAAAF